MVYSLLLRPCEKCGSPETTQVINAEYYIRRGWYCTICFHFTKALYRERLLEKDNND